MAGRKLLGDLISKFESTSPHRVSLESVGGVDAAKRVRAGKPRRYLGLGDRCGGPRGCRSPGHQLRRRREGGGAPSAQSRL